ncbi:MAG: GNAT family N-acetyltransferase [Clostridia bacterium]|nr:GNAT family N-acetyltransferase [Clostridia bacterium]
MITLKSITKEDINVLDDFSYGSMPKDSREQMISHSIMRNHNGKYFEFFLIEFENKIVGVANVVAHSQNVVSVAPEIKQDYRKQGIAKTALEQIFCNLKEKGFKVAYAGIREDNIASIKLNEALGFEYVQDFINSKGNRLKLFIKAL